MPVEKEPEKQGLQPTTESVKKVDEFFDIIASSFEPREYEIPKYHNTIELLDTIICVETNGNTILLLTIILLAMLITWLRLYWVLFIIFYYSNQYMQSSVMRIKKKVYMKAKKDLALKDLDTDSERVEWLNQFLRRFWINFEPSLSNSIKETVDLTLELYKPAALTELRLTTFTLGSDGPRINGIKTYPRNDESLVMDWYISFTPIDDDMFTEKELLVRESRNMQIELLAKMSVVPLPIYIAIRDFSLIGTMRVQMKFMNEYPHIKVVDIAFMEPPEVDFVLKPLKAVDINKFGDLGGMIRNIVQGQLSALMVNPMKMSFPIGEWMSPNFGALQAPVGVLRVSIYEAKGLKNVDIAGSISDPSAEVYIGGQMLAKTRTIDNNLDPKWNETFYIVLYKNTFTDLLNKSDVLKIVLEHGNSISKKPLGSTEGLSLAKWIRLFGAAEMLETDLDGDNIPDPLTDEELDNILIQWGSPIDDHLSNWNKIILDRRAAGSVKTSLTYFPIFRDPLTSSEGPAAPLPDSQAGIITVTVHQAKELAVGESGSVTAQVFDAKTGKAIFETPKRKHTGNPTWEFRHDYFTEDKTKDELKFEISNHDKVIGTCVIGVLASLSSEDDWYKIKGRGTGKIRISTKFKPVDYLQTTSDSTKAVVLAPMGLFKIDILSASDLANKELLSKSDPYCKVYLNGRSVGITNVQESTLEPLWNETFYPVAYSLKEHLNLEIFDENQLSKDELMGKVSIPLAPIFEYLKVSKDPKIMNKIAKLEVDGLKVTPKPNGVLEVHAPLYHFEEKVEMDVEEILNSEKGEKKGLKKMKSELASIAKSSTSLIMRGGASILKEISMAKTLMKGVVKFEIRLFQVEKDKIIHPVDAIPNADIKISPTETPGPKTEPPGKPVIVKSKILSQISSGIFRLKISKGEFAEKICPYVDVYIGEERIISTGVSHEPCLIFQWHSSVDHFVGDIKSVKFQMHLRNQEEKTKRGDDPIVAIWEGNLVDELLGKGSYWVPFRKYSSRYETEKLNPTIYGKIRMSFGFSPVALDVELIGAEDMGILHLDLLSAKDLPAADSNGKSDPYCVVTMNGKFLHKTKVHKKTLNPVFDEGLEIEVSSRLRSKIFIEIYDSDMIGKDTLLGNATLKLASIKVDHVTNSELSIGDSKGKLSIRYFFEPKDLMRSMSVEMLAEKGSKNSKLLTETNSLGKFGRGLTSHVTGMLKKDKKSEKVNIIVKPPVDIEPEVDSKESKEATQPDSKVQLDKDRIMAKRKPVKAETLNSLSAAEGKSITNETLTPAPAAEIPKVKVVVAPIETVITDLVSKSRTVSSSTDLSGPTTGLQNARASPSLKSTSSALDRNDGEFLEILIQVLEARNLACGHAGTSDPYVKVYVEVKSKTKSVLKTAACKKTINPKWEDEMVLIPLKSKKLTLNVLDHITLGKDHPLGSVTIFLQDLFNEAEQFDKWFLIEGGSGELHVQGSIILKAEEKKRFGLSLGRKRRISNASRSSMFG